MSFYWKKRVMIEAKQLTQESASEISSWANCVIVNGPTGVESAQIKTLEGTMTANLNDWIICGVKDEFYPCKPDIFEETYEPVE